VDLVARPEGLDIAPHGFDTPGDVTADDLHLRREETVEQAHDKRRALHHRPVPIVDGRGVHANQNLAGFRRGFCHVPKLQDVGRAVAFHDDGLHECVPMRTAR
jgi:hypothetical protein